MSPKPHIFLFHGADTYSIAEKVALWKGEFEKKYGKENASVLDCELLATEAETRRALSSLLRSATLFSTTKLVVLKNVFSKATKKQFVEMLTDELESTAPTHFVVLWEEHIDARTSLYKLLKKMEGVSRAQIQEFVLPRGSDLLSWVRAYVQKNSISIDASALVAFVHRFEPPAGHVTWSDDEVSWNLWQITGELKKLSAYAQGRPILKEDIELLAPQNSSAHIFSLVDALLSRNKDSARRLATLIASEGKSGVLGMTAMLAGQFRAFLIVKELTDARHTESDIAKRLSWNPKRLWVVSKKIKGLTQGEILSAYRRLLDAETLLKSSSLPPLSVLERLLLSN